MWDDNESLTVQYVEPSSYANCAANGTCILDPGYASECLNIL
jgi:hypothetical protein